MKIADNIKNTILKKLNLEFSNTLKEKENIIKEQNKTVNELEIRINKDINEMQSILVNIDKGIRIRELNGNKPETTYRNLQEARMKIKSSIADSKTLLNQSGFEYIPRTNFTLISLKNQEGGTKWQKEECLVKD